MNLTTRSTSILLLGFTAGAICCTNPQSQPAEPKESVQESTAPGFGGSFQAPTFVATFTVEGMTRSNGGT